MALARATAVAAQLMQEGVPSSVVQTATGPVTYDESGSQGGAPNQRVEILVGN
jgi:outer membrane protein OmpA-like peptidoglycan-associated protein